MSTPVSSPGGNSSSRQIPLAPLFKVGDHSVPKDVVTRIFMRLASRCELGTILNFSSLNASFSSAFGEWRSAAIDAVKIAKGKTPSVLESSVASAQWNADFEVKLVRLCTRWNNKEVDEPRVIPSIYEGAQTLLSFLALRHAQPALLAKPNPNPMDLMLLNFSVLTSADAPGATGRFIQLPHITLLSHLFQMHNGTLPQTYDSGQLDVFAPVLLDGLDELSQDASSEAAALRAAMLKVVPYRNLGGEPRDGPAPGYIVLMNGVLSRLRLLTSGKEQAELLDQWIFCLPAWALPRLLAVISKSCNPDAQSDGMAQLEPDWATDYVASQRLAGKLLSSHWGTDPEKRQAFLIDLEPMLSLPDNFSWGSGNLGSQDFQDWHLHRLKEWKVAHGYRGSTGTIIDCVQS